MSEYTNQVIDRVAGRMMELSAADSFPASIVANFRGPKRVVNFL